MNFSKKLSGLAVASTMLAGQVSAHSWVWCTDYRVADPTAAPMGPDETDEARRTFDADLCEGYSPNFPTFFDPFQDGVFGLDSGYENRPGFTRGDPNSDLCLSRPNTYTNALPMAQYTSGATECVAYPAKNHVAALTTNMFIPDAGIAIYMAPLGSAITNTNFPATSSFVPDGLLEDFNGVHQRNTIDYLGFQNCPNFDAGNDRATCTMCFTVPEGLDSGEYYFAWHWEFNGGEHYSTCWSAQVAGNGEATTTTTQATTTTTTGATTTTEMMETVDGVECEAIAFALCDRGLGRGTCAVTDEEAHADDPTTGFVCDCEDDFVNEQSNMICNIEGGVQIRITYNVPFSQIQDVDLLELSLSVELGDLFNVDTERLSFVILEGDGGILVTILTISGQSSTDDLSALTMANSLSALQDSGEIHDAGTLASAVSFECLNCDEVLSELEGAQTASAGVGALAPSLAAVAVVAAAAASSLAF